MFCTDVQTLCISRIARSNRTVAAVVIVNDDGDDEAKNHHSQDKIVFMSFDQLILDAFEADGVRL